MHYLNLDTTFRSLPAWADTLRQHTTRDLLYNEKEAYTHSVPELRTWLEAQPETAACLAEAQRKPGESQILYLRSSDPAWLNLPWRKAVTDLPNVQIVATPVLEALPQYAPAIAPPFRILVMISAPVDQETHRKLDYETEEHRIIQALSPLIEQGQVYIDFTDDGSLEALRRKLAERPYHALHFSGHGTYQKGVGMLELENPNTLTQQLVPADAFVQALTATPAHTPPLVVLSACQTAQGDEATDQAGLAHTLVRAGVPAIVAMNESIRDDYAILFASRLYQYIAQGETLPYAFKTATEAIRGAESKEYEKRKGEKVNPEPYQWLIPELLVAKEVLRLVDTQRRPEELLPGSHVFEFTDSGVELVLQRGKAFVGRRKERSELMSALAQQKPILLLGMGGVGKTALAAQLLHGLSLQNPGTNLLVFNELTFKTNAVFERLLALLTEERRRFAQSQLEAARDTAAQMKCILDALRYAEVQVAFVFDNLESFQSGPGQPFQEAYADQEAIIQTVARYKAPVFISEPAAQNEPQAALNAVKKEWTFPLILTARYPLADMEGMVVRNIHQSSLNDFWKRALHTQLYQTYLRFREAQEADIQQKISPDTKPITYLGFIQQLHTRLGGNFRLLEYFDGIMAERPEALRQGWANLQALENELQAAREGMDRGPRSLALGGLLALLTAGERLALQLLAHFRIPVHETALRKQQEQDHLPALGTLARMTLIEQQETQPGWISWYAVPLVKDYLEAHPVAEVDFSHEMAGRYFQNYFEKNNSYSNLTQLEESFYHFCHTGQKLNIASIAERLTSAFYKVSSFKKALNIAVTAEEHAKEALSFVHRNLLAMLHTKAGNYEDAVKTYEDAFEWSLRNNDKQGEATILNNLSQIYSSRSNYVQALKYLLDSFQIQQEISDNSGMAATLSNISAIYNVRGEFDEALDYLYKSLAYARECSDRKGEGTTLNNIAMVYIQKRDYDRVFSLLHESLNIRRELDDQQGEAGTLNNLGVAYCECGNYNQALKYWDESLRIKRELGDKPGEGPTLNNIAQALIAKGQYDDALKYLKKCLHIQQEIGDISGQGSIYINFAEIYKRIGEINLAHEHLKKSLSIGRTLEDPSIVRDALNQKGMILQVIGEYTNAFRCFRESLEISQKLKDRRSEARTLCNIGSYYAAQGDYDQAFSSMMVSIEIQREVGDKSGEASTLAELGVLYRGHMNLERARLFLDNSLQIRQGLGEKAEEAIILCEIAQIYHLAGMNDVALDYLSKSLQIKQQLNDQHGVAIVLSNMAPILIIQGNHNVAIKYLKEALSVIRNSSDKRAKAIILNNLGLAYKAQPDLSVAKAYFQESIELSRKTADKQNESISLDNLGQIFLASHNYELAISSFEASLEIRNNIGDQRNTGITLHNIGMVYMYQGNWKKAREYFRKSENIARNTNDRMNLFPTLYNLALIEWNTGNSPPALIYHEEAWELACSVGDAAAMFEIGEFLGRKLYFDLQDQNKGIEVLTQVCDAGIRINHPHTDSLRLLVASLKKQQEEVAKKRTNGWWRRFGFGKFM
ncbi:MAG: tetratricopeptide repeat protein [Bacteroidia bacterium]|nr:tetratricopeptide repeat protein [Bacteroidia bacterium]